MPEHTFHNPPNVIHQNVVDKLKRKLRDGGSSLIRKPRLTIHSGLNQARATLLGQKLPRIIHIAVTNRCNLRCKHCFASKLDRGKEHELTVDEFRSIYKQSLKMGAYGYHLTGGEPLVRSDLPAIIEALNPSRSYVTFITSAALLDREKITAFKKMGIDDITVSLDSGIAAEHDDFRGRKGLFEQVFNCFDIMNEVGIKPFACMTITDNTIHTPTFLKLVDLTREHNVTLMINYGVRLGNWEGNDDISFSQESKKYLLEIIARNPHVTREEMGNYGDWACPAMNEQIYITAFGDVIPCPFIHISFGNIREEPLADIYRKCLDFEVFGGYPPLCLSGEDPLFINKIMPLTWVENSPVYYKDIENELREISRYYEQFAHPVKR